MVLKLFKRLTGQGQSAAANTDVRHRLAHGLEPLSYLWGLDRGTPILRHYIANFLQEFAADITGRCLEFEGDDYIQMFGHDVTKADVLHVDHSNPKATIVADLTKPNAIPDDHFDCIICTHVLHIIFELERFVSELRRILEPGGVLLVAVPHVSMCDPEWHELWRFTDEGLARVLGKTFGAGKVTTRYYGNSLICAGQLRGLTAEEFTPEELNAHDVRFPVEVCGRAVKA